MRERESLEVVKKRERKKKVRKRETENKLGLNGLSLKEGSVLNRIHMRNIHLSRSKQYSKINGKEYKWF